jgi:hypothetical protein
MDNPKPTPTYEEQIKKAIDLLDKGKPADARKLLASMLATPQEGDDQEGDDQPGLHTARDRARLQQGLEGAFGIAATPGSHFGLGRAR